MVIAIIAHDGKKAEMVQFLNEQADVLHKNEIQLISTGTTGKRIKHAGVEKVQTVNSGPMGGDAEIGSLVAKGELEGVIFFRDPLDIHPHEPDVQMLLRLCDVHDIPLATNYKSAHILVKHYA